MVGDACDPSISVIVGDTCDPSIPVMVGDTVIPASLSWWEVPVIPASLSWWEVSVIPASLSWWGIPVIPAFLSLCSISVTPASLMPLWEYLSPQHPCYGDSTCEPSTREAEAGRPWVPNQPELLVENPRQNEKQNVALKICFLNYKLDS